MKNSVCIPPAGFSNDVEGLSMDSTLKLTKACFCRAAMTALDRKAPCTSSARRSARKNGKKDSTQRAKLSAESFWWIKKFTYLYNRMVTYISILDITRQLLQRTATG